MGNCNRSRSVYAVDGLSPPSRRQSFGASYRDGTNLRLSMIVDYDIPVETRTLLEASLRKLSFIQKRVNIEPFLAVMKKDSWGCGQHVVVEGDSGDRLFIVERGSLNVTIDGAFVRQLEPGDSFGELSLIYGTPRSATVTVGSAESVLWHLKGKDFRHVQRTFYNDSLYANGTLLAQIPALHKIPVDRLSLLASHLLLKRFSPGEVLAKSGANATKLFMIMDGLAYIDLSQNPVDVDSAIGIVRAVDPNWSSEEREDLAKDGRYLYDDIKPSRCNLTKGCIVGEELLLKECYIYPYTVVAQTDIEIAYFTLEMFERMFGPVNDALDGKFFDNVADASVEKVHDFKFELKNFHMSYQLTTIDLGAVAVGTFSKNALTIGPTIKIRNKFHRRKEKITKPDSYVLRIMSKERIYKSNRLELLLKEKTILESLQSPHIANMFGTFQTVNELIFVFERIDGGDLWHLLYDPSRYDGGKTLPFPIPTPGMRGLPIRLVQYYSACIVDALAYMHAKQVAYRNLKAENVLFDSNGEIRIVGFMLAKKVPFKEVISNGFGTFASFEDKREVVRYRTLTFCGPLDYLAPEIVKYLGHDQAADLWALGILIFEMLYCKTPFNVGPSEHVVSMQQGKKQENLSIEETLLKIGKTLEEGVHISELDQSAVNGALKAQELFKKIDGSSLKQSFITYFDPEVQSSDAAHFLLCNDMIRKLLVPEMTQRLGKDIGGTKGILSHPFFSGINVQAIAQGSDKKPPFTFHESETANKFRDFKELLGIPVFEDYVSGPKNAFKIFSP